MRGETRAVSDLVGFVLTFSLVIASVGIVATVGFDQVSETRDREQIRGAEQGMIELAESFDYVLQRTDGDRRAGLALSEGSLTFEQSEIGVTVRPSSGGPAVADRQIKTGAMYQKINDYRVRYEGGAVFAGGGRLVKYKPAVTCRGGTAIVSLLTFDAKEISITSTTKGKEEINIEDTDGVVSRDDGISIDDVSSISDEGSIVVEATYNASESSVIERRTFESGNGVVEVDISSAAFPKGWKRLDKLQDQQWKLSSSGDTLRCTSVKYVLVRQTAVDVTLSGA